MQLREITGIYVMNSENLNYKALPEQQVAILNELASKEWITSFYLAGGTSISLRLGHRKSYDFDFFTQEQFDADTLLFELKQIGNIKVVSRTENILHCFLNSFEISFFKVKYPLIDKTLLYKKLEIASLLDLFLIKLQAIAGRGSKKDFIDIYYLLKIFSLDDTNRNYERKYGISFQSDIHLHKSLVYFDDADKRVMPELFEDISWSDIKAEIINKVTSYNKYLKL